MPACNRFRDWTVRKNFLADQLPPSPHTAYVATTAVEEECRDPRTFVQSGKPSLAGLTLHTSKATKDSDGKAMKETRVAPLWQIAFEINHDWRMLVLFDPAAKEYMVHNVWESDHDYTNERKNYALRK